MPKILTHHRSIWFAIGAGVLAQCLMVQLAAFSEDKNPAVLVPHETIMDEKAQKAETKTPRLTCGQCPEGYAKTGVTKSSTVCKGMFKSEDATLLECMPIGMQNQMPVCGSCPEGYREVGRTLSPPLCGNEDGGLRTQCQMLNPEGNFPDPTAGGKKCPPDCVGNLPAPGQGNMPAHPPKFPSVEIRKKPEETP